jgi:O-antigen biosynthesis protein
MGNTGAAIGDLTRALEFAPEDLAANRRMLAWARGERQHDAARALLRVERDFEVLRKAIDVLRRNGNTAFANVMVVDETIEGWAVWEGNDSIEISMTAEAESTTRLLDGDPRHPLRDFGWAASFTLRRPKWRGAQSIRISLAGKQFYSAQAPGDHRKRVGSSNATVRSGGDPQITVIVPVFGDYQATRACLESLRRNLQEAVHHRAILVNDATPDPRIENYLVELGHQPGFELLTNATNLGFVGSVNRALERTAAGDVVLLNSDTIVPPGFLERLAAAAHFSADIGTVMPLSNNGDLAGFPVPNTVTPIGSHQEVTRLDAIAAQTNAGQVIDIPNGIGFCLYITRACLDAVGLLSEDYDRGYLEDADFCLRAREAGFRNVCAPSVYVGHAGSRSFVAEKSFLVSRNLKTLEQRFPKYRFEYGAFSLLDSIRPCREAIERAVGCDLIGPKASRDRRRPYRRGSAGTCARAGIRGPSELDPGIANWFGWTRGSPDQYRCCLATTAKICTLLNERSCRLFGLRQEPTAFSDRNP